MALEAQNNPFTSVLMVGAADPEAIGDTDPSAGSYRLVMGTDDKLYILDEAGVATEVGAAAGAVATDAIWDAAGDLVQGTGANTAAKLSAGTAGKVLTSNGAAAALTWETPSAGGGVDNWLIEVTPIIGSHGNTNWSTRTASALYYAGFDMESGGAQNDEIYWDLGISAGTWDLTLFHNKGPNRGIYTVSIDGSSVGTIDGYAASGSGVELSTDSITAISIAGGKRRLKLKMATKNGSASTYYGTIQLIQLRRTA